MPALWAGRAQADGLEVEKAVALFQEGRRLAEQSRYGEACERFEQSLSLAEGIGTSFNLADCWERLGRTASAQALFTEVATSAKQAGQLERAQVASERAAALEARVARLSIEVESAAGAKPRVRRNGVEVAPSEWGKPLPVDPGVYEIQATAKDRTGFTRTVRVPATPAVVLVTIPALAASEAPRPEERTARARAAIEPEPVAEDSVPPPPPEAQHRFGAASIGLTALGVGGLAAGTYFLLKYRSANDEAKAICPNSVTCPRDSIDRHAELVDDAKTSRLGMFVGFGVGGAALSAALIAYLVPSSDKASDDHGGVVLSPVVADDGVGVFARARF
jgi:tetratricopeptide (TPR) repeat protein